MEDTVLKNIMDKLGFNPKDYRYAGVNTEDDNYHSPFSKLTLEELEYLAENQLI